MDELIVEAISIAGWILSIIIIVPLWRICARAGINPAISLLGLVVPFLGIIIVGAVLSFGAWPSVAKQNLKE